MERTVFRGAGEALSGTTCTCPCSASPGAGRRRKKRLREEMGGNSGLRKEERTNEMSLQARREEGDQEGLSPMPPGVTEGCSHHPFSGLQMRDYDLPPLVPKKVE